MTEYCRPVRPTESKSELHRVSDPQWLRLIDKIEITFYVRHLTIQDRRNELVSNHECSSDGLDCRRRGVR